MFGPMYIGERLEENRLGKKSKLKDAMYIGMASTGLLFYTVAGGIASVALMKYTNNFGGLDKDTSLMIGKVLALPGIMLGIVHYGYSIPKGRERFRDKIDKIYDSPEYDQMALNDIE